MDTKNANRVQSIIDHASELQQDLIASQNSHYDIDTRVPSWISDVNQIIHKLRELQGLRLISED